MARNEIKIAYLRDQLKNWMLELGALCNDPIRELREITEAVTIELDKRECKARESMRETGMTFNLD